MHLLIIGASRGIGWQLLHQALAAGHAVTAFSRRPRIPPAGRESLRVMTGDILEAAAVQEAVRGQDAVLITIGMGVTFKPVSLFSRGTQNVLSAMAGHGVRRLMCVTGIGAGDSRGHGGLVYDRLVLPLLLKTIYRDKDRQESLIRASATDWTIVRPGFLTNGPLTGRYRVVTDLTGVTADRISRADVAHFMLTELTANRCLGQSPLLTY
jgi:putative NADH-flavin reductase